MIKRFNTQYNIKTGDNKHETPNKEDSIKSSPSYTPYDKKILDLSQKNISRENSVKSKEQNNIDTIQDNCMSDKKPTKDQTPEITEDYNKIIDSEDKENLKKSSEILDTINQNTPDIRKTKDINTHPSQITRFSTKKDIPDVLDMIENKTIRRLKSKFRPNYLARARSNMMNVSNFKTKVLDKVQGVVQDYQIDVNEDSPIHHTRKLDLLANFVASESIEDLRQKDLKLFEWKYGPILSSILSGRMFGELAFETNASRLGTAICTENCEFLILNKADYMNCVQLTVAENKTKKREFLEDLFTKESFKTVALDSFQHYGMVEVNLKKGSMTYSSIINDQVLFLKEGLYKLSVLLTKEVCEYALDTILKNKKTEKTYMQKQNKVQRLDSENPIEKWVDISIFDTQQVAYICNEQVLFDNHLEIQYCLTITSLDAKIFKVKKPDFLSLFNKTCMKSIRIAYNKKIDQRCNVLFNQIEKITVNQTIAPIEENLLNISFENILDEQKIINKIRNMKHSQLDATNQTIKKKLNQTNEINKRNNLDQKPKKASEIEGYFDSYYRKLKPWQKKKAQKERNIRKGQESEITSKKSDDMSKTWTKMMNYISTSSCKKYDGIVDANFKVNNIEQKIFDKTEKLKDSRNFYCNSESNFFNNTDKLPKSNTTQKRFYLQPMNTSNGYTTLRHLPKKIDSRKKLNWSFTETNSLLNTTFKDFKLDDIKTRDFKINEQTHTTHTPETTKHNFQYENVDLNRSINEEKTSNYLWKSKNVMSRIKTKTGLAHSVNKHKCSTENYRDISNKYREKTKLHKIINDMIDRQNDRHIKKKSK